MSKKKQELSIKIEKRPKVKRNEPKYLVTVTYPGVLKERMQIAASTLKLAKTWKKYLENQITKIENQESLLYLFPDAIKYRTVDLQYDFIDALEMMHETWRRYKSGKLKEIDLGKNIRRLRKFHGLSIREFAQAVGMTPSQISMFETGKREPNKDHIDKICKTFHVKLKNIFLGWDD